MSRVWYNEIDSFAAQWLRNLGAAGHLPAGEVETRSIREIAPEDCGAEQCHFFAGIGGWPLALRLAGWPIGAPVWTGSCPCQPFSVAGRRRAAADERHLWPVWFELIRECRPPVVFGEQVTGPDGLWWLDALSADLEGCGYAFGAAVLPAASVGAPHERHRIYWVADDSGAQRHGGERVAETNGRGGSANGRGADVCGCWDPDAWHRKHGMRAGEVCINAGGVGDAHGERAGERRGARAGEEAQGEGCRGADRGVGDGARAPGAARGVVHADRNEREGEQVHLQPWGSRQAVVDVAGAGSERGAWSDLAWLPCADGTARPTQPGLRPLAHGVSGRVAVVRTGEQTGAARQTHWYSRSGALKGLGNAIVPQVAAVFIRAYLLSLTAGARGPS